MTQCMQIPYIKPNTLYMLAITFEQFKSLYSPSGQLSRKLKWACLTMTYAWWT